MQQRSKNSMLRSLSVAAVAGAVLTADTALGQPAFNADAAVADGAGFGITAAAGAANAAADDLFAEDSTVQLRRQKLIPVGTLPRSCDCNPATSVVRTRGRHTAAQ